MFCSLTVSTAHTTECVLRVFHNDEYEYSEDPSGDI
jgi:hypothetical protein